MIMHDYVKPQERIDLPDNTLYDYADHECCGCGKSSDQIALEDGWTDEDFSENSLETDWGHWYCHLDCWRDSRG